MKFRQFFEDEQEIDLSGMEIGSPPAPQLQGPQATIGAPSQQMAPKPPRAKAPPELEIDELQYIASRIPDGYKALNDMKLVDKGTLRNKKNLDLFRSYLFQYAPADLPRDIIHMINSVKKPATFTKLLGIFRPRAKQEFPSTSTTSEMPYADFDPETAGLAPEEPEAEDYRKKSHMPLPAERMRPPRKEKPVQDPFSPSQAVGDYPEEGETLDNRLGWIANHERIGNNFFNKIIESLKTGMGYKPKSFRVDMDMTQRTPRDKKLMNQNYKKAALKDLVNIGEHGMSPEELHELTDLLSRSGAGKIRGDELVALANMWFKGDDAPVGNLELTQDMADKLIDKFKNQRSFQESLIGMMGWRQFRF
jgi:hypothetical protein